MTRDEVLAIIKQAEEEGWEELDLSGQGLTELPEEIGRLSKLTVLKVGADWEKLLFNSLKTLPESLAQLTNLQHLDLSSNGLETLPQEIGQLHQLKVLKLGGSPRIIRIKKRGQITTPLTTKESLAR